MSSQLNVQRIESGQARHEPTSTATPAAAFPVWVLCGKGASGVIVFIDFEASSLGRSGFPVSVGWATDTGQETCYLIRPAPGWDEWSAKAEAIHHLTREHLAREGTPHEVVAARMVAALEGAELYASAPSWDGKWLSALLRAAGLPRHALRLKSSKDFRRSEAAAVLASLGVPEAARPALVDAVLEASARAVAEKGPPAHQALADARQELWLWQEVRRRSEERAGGGSI